MKDIFAEVSLPDVNDIHAVTGSEVHQIVQTMCNNKAGDCYGLCAEHYKLVGGDLYYSFLALCFNVMLVHGYIPTEATQTVICPIVKDKNCDPSDVSNYHPIALATIFSKFFEHVLLNRLHDYLLTSDNQFGFKHSHSTLMPIMLLKEL